MGRGVSGAVVLAVAALVGAGCGEPPGETGPTVVVPGGPGEQARVLPGAEAAQRRTPVPVSPADVEFVTQMIPHHRQALEMTALVPGRASDPQVAAIAERIDAVQEPEIAVLEAWLERQDHVVDAHGAHSVHPMPGMATPAQLDALAAATGPAFDRMFVELMTAHHEGAITMAHDLGLRGTDVTAAEIARDIAVTQTAEIDRMRAIIG